MKTITNKIFRNWFIHNVIGHPVSEMLYWIILPFDATKASVASVWFHDATCPNKGHKDEAFS